MEYGVYSVRYDEEEDKVYIVEYDAAIMPCHAAIDENDFCVSKYKDNAYLIAQNLYPDKEISFIPWEE